MSTWTDPPPATTHPLLLLLICCLFSVSDIFNSLYYERTRLSRPVNATTRKKVAMVSFGETNDVATKSTF